MLGDALERWGYLPRRWRLGPVSDVTVVADRDRLALALDALLENAIAHTGSGDEIEVSARQEDGHVVLMVADSGSGIAPADLDRIFQRFARANPQRSGEAAGSGWAWPSCRPSRPPTRARSRCGARRAGAPPSSSSSRSARRSRPPPNRS